MENTKDTEKQEELLQEDKTQQGASDETSDVAGQEEAVAQESADTFSPLFARVRASFRSAEHHTFSAFFHDAVPGPLRGKNRY